MKTHRFAPLLIVISLAAFTHAGCAEKAKPADAVKPAASPAPTSVVPATESPEVVSARWTDIKDYTYDQRDLLLSGLKGLESQVDDQISELAAKRAALEASNTSTQSWDLAMKDMGEARTALKSTSDDLSKATRENWDQLKEKVGVAWTRTQDAYSKVKASTTN
jgi:hypothetical protein